MLAEGGDVVGGVMNQWWGRWLAGGGGAGCAVESRVRGGVGGGWLRNGLGAAVGWV